MEKRIAVAGFEMMELLWHVVPAEKEDLELPEGGERPVVEAAKGRRELACHSSQAQKKKNIVLLALWIAHPLKSR